MNYELIQQNHFLFEGVETQVSFKHLSCYSESIYLAGA